MTQTAENPVTDPETPPDGELEEAAPDATPVEPGPVEAPDEPLHEPGEPAPDEAQPEAPAEPVPGEVPDGMTPEAMEKEFKRVDRAAQRWSDTVVEFITSTQQPIIRCEACLPGMPGFLFSPAVQAPTDNQVKFARALAGMPEQPPLIQGANVRTCPACEGWGDVLTGSKRNDQVKMKCNTCGGRGFVGEGPQAQQVANGVTDTVALVALETSADDTADKDPWGRPPEHPGYMIFPHDGMAAELRPAGWPA